MQNFWPQKGVPLSRPFFSQGRHSRSHGLTCWSGQKGASKGSFWSLAGVLSDIERIRLKQSDAHAPLSQPWGFINRRADSKCAQVPFAAIGCWFGLAQPVEPYASGRGGYAVHVWKGLEQRYPMEQVPHTQWMMVKVYRPTSQNHPNTCYFWPLVG